MRFDVHPVHAISSPSSASPQLARALLSLSLSTPSLSLSLALPPSLSSAPHFPISIRAIIDPVFGDSKVLCLLLLLFVLFDLAFFRSILGFFYWEVHNLDPVCALYEVDVLEHQRSLFFAASSPNSRVSGTSDLVNFLIQLKIF